MGNYDSALQSFQQDLKIRLEKLEDNHPHTADCYESIGITQLFLGDYTLALKLQKLAVESSYRAIGVTHGELGNYTLSLRSHKRALKIYSELLGENHLETARSYNYIGVIQGDLGTILLPFSHTSKHLKFIVNDLGRTTQKQLLSTITLGSHKKIGRLYFSHSVIPASTNNARNTWGEPPKHSY